MIILQKPVFLLDWFEWGILNSKSKWVFSNGFSHGKDDFLSAQEHTKSVKISSN